MKKLQRLLSLGLVLPSVLLLVLAPAFASAASTSATGNGLKVSPVRTDLTIEPGNTQTVTITVQNVTGSTATFQAIINDFVATSGNETGQPDLILDPNKYAPSHSLKRFVAPVPDVTLAAGESKEVKVNISVPTNAAGGGYFGAVRFAPAGSSDAGKNVTLSASVGSLILVKVPGNIKEQLTLETFDVRQGDPNKAGASGLFMSGKDLNAVARFKNSGDVQEQPFGKVVLKKGGKVIASSEINNTDPRGNVLPDSIRRFSVSLDKASGWGKYTVEGNFGYGTKGQLLSATTSFYVIPVLLIVLVVLAVAVLLFLIFGLPRLIKRYNQRVLRKAGRR
jgi:hypothetical protein